MVWTPNNLLGAHWCLLCTLQMETAGTPESLLINHWTTPCFTREDHCVRIQHYQQVKAHVKIGLSG
jgi:hypothetical protein